MVKKTFWELNIQGIIIIIIITNGSFQLFYDKNSQELKFVVCFACRSYYRCTFRNTQNCCATKQVQRSDGDPTIFDVTYRGEHTCSQGIPPPEKQHTTKPNHTLVNYQNDLLDNLGTNLTVRTDGIEGDAFSFPVTSPFYSYESINGDFGGTFCHVGCSGPSDFTGLISTNTSTGSSPIFDVDFQFDPTAEIDKGFHTIRD